MKLLILFSFLIILSTKICFSQDTLNLTKYSKKEQAIINTVQEQIEIISSPKSDRFTAEDAIEKVLDLCLEEATIQVKSKSREQIFKHKAKTYLIKLRLLKYAEVKIKSVNFNEVDKIVDFEIMN